MSIDVGNLLGTLGSEFIRAKYGPSVSPPTTTPTFQIPGTGMDISGDLPFVDITSAKKHRRRRRRLLTPTDFNDLALLKTLTGRSEAFNAAVIKAVRR